MGYLQVSITVVGPGEHKPKHDRVAEKAAEQAEAEARAAKRGSRNTMHIPPHVLTKSGMKATEYLTLRFYEVVNLPTLNKDSGMPGYHWDWVGTSPLGCYPVPRILPIHTPRPTAVYRPFPLSATLYRSLPLSSLTCTPPPTTVSLRNVPHQGHVHICAGGRSSHIRLTFASHLPHIRLTFVSYSSHFRLTFPSHFPHISLTFRSLDGHETGPM